MTAFHEGERAVQERAGVRAMAERIAGSIHDRIPERAADFLRGAPLIVTGLLDSRGHPWASPVAGLPGVVDVPDEGTLALAHNARALLPDGEAPAPGDPIGLLALEPATRRRARVNGRIEDVRETGLRIAVDQAYSNCPKYIQKRSVVAPAEPHVGLASVTSPPGRRETGSRLTTRQLDWIRRADTFFIASAHPAHGADASHRGGLPGFVDAVPGSVSWPDYPGNTMFNTLGNLSAYPRAGLLFVDFHDGATLRVTGAAHIDWGDPGDADAGRVGRPVTVTVERVVETAGELPLAFRLEEYSPNNPPVG